MTPHPHTHARTNVHTPLLHNARHICDTRQHYLKWCSLCMKRRLCLRVLNMGFCVASGLSWSTSTKPSSGRIVSHHSREMLSLHDVINMLATDPLKTHIAQYRDRQARTQSLFRPHRDEIIYISNKIEPCKIVQCILRKFWQH